MGDAATPSKDALLSQLKALVSPDEIITPESPSFKSNSEVWSHAHYLNPKLVLRPRSLDSLSKIIAFLGPTDLDFKVRSQGYGNASARDVLISLTAFDDFGWDEENKIVTLGPGIPWAKYYDEMPKVAPGWTIVCARTPCIGVGGSTLCSGFSWLSHEYGCVSDPANMLDAQVVKLDGSVVWASSEPDLLWALRGTETGFGVVTAFKFQARPYPQDGKIYAGPIFIPRNKVPEAAKGIVSMIRTEDGRTKEVDPKVSMFLYVMRKELLYLIGVSPDQDVLVVHCFDALGEEHGRETFRWALEIEGAVDMTKGNMTLKDVAKMQEHIGEFRGHATTFWSPLALTDLTEEIILNSFAWWTDVLSSKNSVAENNWLLFELFSCRDNLTGRSSSAWPRPKGYKHMVLLGTGYAKDWKERGEDEEVVRRMAVEKIGNGPDEILGEKGKGVMIVPNGVQEEIRGHEPENVWGKEGHLERLTGIKTKYDPKMRFGGHILPVGA